MLRNGFAVNNTQIFIPYMKNLTAYMLYQLNTHQ